MTRSTGRPRRARGIARRPRRGVTVVEMVVAIVVLAIGIIGLAGTAAMVARQLTGGAQQTVAGTAAQARFERLASVSCASLLASPTGSATGRGVTEVWRVESGANRTLAMYVTLTYLTSGGRRTTDYVSMRAC